MRIFILIGAVMSVGCGSLQPNTPPDGNFGGLNTAEQRFIAEDLFIHSVKELDRETVFNLDARSAGEIDFRTFARHAGFDFSNQESNVIVKIDFYRISQSELVGTIRMGEKRIIRRYHLDQDELVVVGTSVASQAH